MNSENFIILKILMLTIYSAFTLAATNKATYGYNPKPIHIVNGYRESPAELEHENTNSSIVNPNFDFKMFPNPASSEVQLQFEGELPSAIEIADITGNIIYRQNTKDKVINITLNEFANGFYLVKAINGVHQNKIKQLIITH